MAGSFIEVQHVNYAWGPVYKGYVINGIGEVFSWDRAGKPWTAEDANSPTAAELNGKYENKTPVRTLPASEAGALFSLANTAANGTVTAPAQRCNDAGATTITVWLAQGEGRMKKVVIRMEGDWAQENLSAAAKTLASRVDQLELMPHGACSN